MPKNIYKTVLIVLKCFSDSVGANLLKCSDTVPTQCHSFMHLTIHTHHKTNKIICTVRNILI